MPVDVGVPTLETERLVLRAHQLADFPAIRDMWADPAVTRHIGGKPRPEEEVWLKFLRTAGSWAHLGYGYWIIEEKATGDVVGEAGFGEYKRNIDPPIKGEPEIGWALGAAYHGNGYASEAALAAVHWGAENIKARRFSCIINVDNTASFRIAEKCGFVRTRRAVYHGEDLVVLHRG